MKSILWADMKYIVAVGDPFDSINFHGPFDDFDDAEKWGDQCGMFHWILGLQKP